MTIKFHLWRIVYLLVGAICVYGCVQLLATFLGRTFEADRASLLKQIRRLVESSRTDNSLVRGQACRHPQLSLHDPDIMRFVSQSPPIDCGPELDWVAVSGGTASITEEARARHGDVQCRFTEFTRVGDYKTQFGTTVHSPSEYRLQESDFFVAQCKAPSGKRWRSVMAGIREDRAACDRSGWEKLPPDALRLNVLMFGYDSLSRNMFIRQLPKTHRYLQETLRAVTLEGYNIVGDGTPQALIPILTGWTELELPETRRRMEDEAHFVNVYPFIWTEFQENGYVTAFMEDCPDYGTFTYRLKGFDAQPTDHYMRPYYLVASKKFSRFPKYCMGSVPRHKLMMNYAKDFFQVYREKPKFLFGFHGELSHDAVNLIGAADDDMVEWLQTLNAEGHLNNTLLIIMSDHGNRFADMRNTLQGKQEERLPFFSFVFPPWFEATHPQAMANFRLNAHRLTTPFDIHATLGAVLHFPGTARGSVVDRSIALFQEVPQERTCADAFIEPHWCACLDWQEVSISDPLVTRAADALVSHINRYTNDHRNICADLRAERVLWAAQLLPTEGLLRYRKNQDKDGFVGDMSDQTAVSHRTLQVKVATQPGGGLFEASLTYNVRDDNFVVQMADISRINRYGSDAHCVYDMYEHLRKYCYCKEPAP